MTLTTKIKEFIEDKANRAIILFVGLVTAPVAVSSIVVLLTQAS